MIMKKETSSPIQHKKDAAPSIGWIGVGVGMSKMRLSRLRKVSRLDGQDFHRLKRECLKGQHLFVDPEFPPTNVSLFLDRNRSADIVWKRPSELCDNPRLFVEGASPNDVTQGILGNCWFVSACSALTHNEALLEKVIPDANGQEWGPNYSGIFLFQFWRFGEWIQVVIDDLLPTKDGKLLFARSKTPNEFWSALLEKAFAKLYGCYENLVGGQLADALQDVSGGVAETINVKKYFHEEQKSTPTDLFRLLRTAFDQQALIVAAIAAKSKEDIETSLHCGLVVGHAYAVTAVRYIQLDTASPSNSEEFDHSTASRIFSTPLRKMMIRLQNPWGEKEWNGPWSDDSPEWEQVSSAHKAELGITVDEDGEFWMPWDEFIRYFTDISVCQLFNTSAAKKSKAFQLRYHEFVAFDRWTTNNVKLGAPNDRAGGCANFPGTFCLNPQYCFDIKHAQELMLALTQKEVPPVTGKQREPFITIGMHVMRVECNRKYRIHQAIDPVGTSDYVGSRSVYLHLKGMIPGRYIVIPTTYAPREQTEFMLRIYSNENLRPRLLDDDFPIFEMFGIRACNQPKTVSRIKIYDLQIRLDSPKHVSIVITHEGQRHQSPLHFVDKETISIDESFILHSKFVCQKISAEVWTLSKKGILKCFARSSLQIKLDNDSSEEILDVKKVKGMGNDIIGRISLKISSFDDPYYL
uniref:Calpain catalytic domain-containing protein n=2 Tax=Bursaphelenchus xylophilus TaxID=6326 RepID=A0A1I7SLZ9_BURXY